jgi:recombination protein RecR
MKSIPSLERLIKQLKKLPGIGPKGAQRIALYLLKQPPQDVAALASVLREVKERIRFCSCCFNLTEADPCDICTDPARDQNQLCVVEEANDLLAIEKTGAYKGLYHVLQGAISPLEGMGPDDLRIRELLLRLQDRQGKEVILATNPNTVGEATALYLLRLLKPLGVKVTRIARGLPVGGDLEYADEVTLSRAMEGRREL